MTLPLERTSLLRVDDGGDSVVDGLVGQGPEIDVRWAGGCPGALGHQDDNHVLPGVGIPGGAQAAVPAVPTGYRRNVVAPGDHGDAESPTLAVKEAGEQARHRFLLRRQLVGRHELNRQPRQKAPIAMFAQREHHLTKGQVVVDGRDQSPRSRRKGRGAAPLAPLGSS